MRRDKPLPAAGKMGDGGAQVVPDAAVDYHDFFENAPVALHVVGADGAIQQANQAELQLLGYAREDYVGRPIADFHVDSKVIENILTRLRRGESLDRVGARLRAQDGSIKDVEISASPHLVDGEFVHSRCFSVDVSELRRTKDELDRRDQSFRQILESLPVAVYTTDPSGNVTYFNQAAVDFAGRQPEIGKDEWCITHSLFTSDGQPLPRGECPMATALRENRPVRNVEAIAQRPDGTLVPFLPFPTPVRDVDGSLIGGVNTLVDLSEIRRMDVAAHHLSAIVESSFDAIVSKDLTGTITSWNEAAQRLFGYASEEAVGQHVTMLIPEDRCDEEPRILERIRRGERVESFETVRRRKDGTLIPVSLTISPVRSASGRIIGASKIARDVSAMKESEHRIRMLMREVNHRVKNQYAVILSMVRETNKRAKSSDAFERLVRERIMALSRSHDLLVAADWKGATISQLLAAQIKIFSEEERVVMSGPAVMLSPNAVQHLGMAFHELGTNSAKYGVLSGAEGTVEVTWDVTEEADGKVLRLTWREKDGPEVQHIATDNGFGSVVLKRVAPVALSGTSELLFGPHGVTWTLQAPLKALEADTTHP